MRCVCFLSDFGYSDDFAGTCRGVIAGIAPQVNVIDITHGIARGDVLTGALTLRNTARYMPEGAVHLAIVDPGVGGARRAIVVRSGENRLFVGPDNGLLGHAAEASGGIVEAWEIADRELFLEPVSATFHARDVFSPVAARLAAGLAPDGVGPAVKPGSLHRIEIPLPQATAAGLVATVLGVDGFGNVALNVDDVDLVNAGLGDELEVVVTGKPLRARRAPTFVGVAPGQLLAYIDSYGQLALALNGEAAAQLLRVAAGDAVELRRPAERRHPG